MIEILRILLFETMEKDPIYLLCANLFMILDGAYTREITDVYYNILFDCSPNESQFLHTYHPRKQKHPKPLVFNSYMSRSSS